MPSCWDNNESKVDHVKIRLNPNLALYGLTIDGILDVQVIRDHFNWFLFRAVEKPIWKVITMSSQNKGLHFC